MIPFSQYISLKGQYIFYRQENTEQITAGFWNPDRELKDLPVNLTAVPSCIPPGSSTEKVNWLVHNHHFIPAIRQNTQSQQEEVVFQLIPPEQKERKIFRERLFIDRDESMSEF